MDAIEYKNYLLGLVFYKYLSDTMLYSAAELLEVEVADLNEAQKIYVKLPISLVPSKWII